MEKYYKIIIQQILYQKIQQKNRTLTKKKFVLIGIVHNIPLNELSKEVIKVKSKYKDFNYIVEFEREAK